MCGERVVDQCRSQMQAGAANAEWERAPFTLVGILKSQKPLVFSGKMSVSYVNGLKVSSYCPVDNKTT